MHQSLAGKTAIITGAGRGIGRSIAETLAKQNMKLALLARTKEQLEEVARRVDDLGGEGMAEECDLCDPDAIKLSVRRVIDRFKAIDVFISNAATFLEKPLGDISLEEWEQVMRVNLTAPFLFFQEMLRIMKRQGKGGKIITIASSSSMKGYVDQSAYSSSKHGLLGLARCLAIEAQPHKIHVHTICPGGVRTDFLKGSYCGERVSRGPLIEPQDIADMVLFLIRQQENVDIPEIILKRFTPSVKTLK